MLNISHHHFPDSLGQGWKMLLIVNAKVKTKDG